VKNVLGEVAGTVTEQLVSRGEQGGAGGRVRWQFIVDPPERGLAVSDPPVVLIGEFGQHGRNVRKRGDARPRGADEARDETEVGEVLGRGGGSPDANRASGLARI
jgi:hypothetical protein